MRHHHKTLQAAKQAAGQMAGRRSLVAMALAAAALGLWARQARAQGMADHVPADAMVYMEWAGMDAAGEGYKGSNLEGIVNALDIRGRIEKALSQAQEAAADEPDKKAGIALMKGWTESVIHAPGMLYVGPVDFTGATPMPKIAVVSKVGSSRAQEMAALAQSAIDKKEKDPNTPPISVVASGDYLVLNVGAGVAADKWMATAPGEALSASAKFKAAMAQSKVPGVPVLSLYVDGAAGVQSLLEATTKIPQPEVQQFAPVIIDAMGLSALRSISGTGAFEGKGWVSRGFVGLEGERKGLMGFFDYPALTPESYAMIPSGAAWASVFRFDGNRLITDVRDAVVKINPETGQQFDQVMRQVYAFTGVDIQKDLFASLGDTFEMYATPEADGTIQRITLVNRLKDAEKGEQALTSLEVFGNQMMQQRGGNGVSFSQEALDAPNDKVMAHLVTTPVGTGAWAVKDGVLYVSGGKTGIEQALKVAGKGLAADPKFIALKAKLGQQDIGGFAYSDLNLVGPGYYNAMTSTIKQLTEMQGIQMADMPSFDLLKPYMGAGLSVWWTDAAGIHAAETGPFPGWSGINPMSEMQVRMQKAIMGEETPAAPAAPDAPATPPAGM